MSNMPRLLLLLALLAFVLAVVASFAGNILTIQAESFSRACTNLALLAIGISLAWKAMPE